MPTEYSANLGGERTSGISNKCPPMTAGTVRECMACGRDLAAEVGRWGDDVKLAGLPDSADYGRVCGES